MPPAYCEKLDRALTLAAVAHANLDRKGSRVPYIMHPVHVGLILQKHGYGEDVVAAGLLHDVLEDTDWDDRLTWERFRHTFPENIPGTHQPEPFRGAVQRLIRQTLGSTVHELVQHLTEQKVTSAGESIRWQVRKKEQLRRLRDPATPPEAVAIKGADALHNLHAIQRDVTQQGIEALQRFSTSPKDHFWFHARTVTLIQYRLGPSHPLAAELDIAIRAYAAVLPDSQRSMLERELEAARRDESHGTTFQSGRVANQPLGNQPPDSGRLYLMNSPVLTGYGRWQFEPLTTGQARDLLTGGFESAVGHSAAARFFTSQLGVEVAVSRVSVDLQPGDRAIVLRLKGRLPEGKVLSQEEMNAFPFELGLLTKVE